MTAHVQPHLHHHCSCDQQSNSVCMCVCMCVTMVMKDSHLLFHGRRPGSRHRWDFFRTERIKFISSQRLSAHHILAAANVKVLFHAVQTLNTDVKWSRRNCKNLYQAGCEWTTGWGLEFTGGTAMTGIIGHLSIMWLWRYCPLLDTQGIKPSALQMHGEDLKPESVIWQAFHPDRLTRLVICSLPARLPDASQHFIFTPHVLQQMPTVTMFYSIL